MFKAVLRARTDGFHRILSFKLICHGIDQFQSGGLLLSSLNSSLSQYQNKIIGFCVPGYDRMDATCTFVQESVLDRV